MFLDHACNVLKQQGERVGKHNISLTIYIQKQKHPRNLATETSP